MACEVPGNASRGLEKRSAVQGGFPVAEAKVQATTSLTLHGMAGLKGCRPVPPTPLLVECEDCNRRLGQRSPGAGKQHGLAGPRELFSPHFSPGADVKTSRLNPLRTSKVFAPASVLDPTSVT